jgi:cyclopropane-fatty-acyl-phospholipid synthase
MSSDATAYPNRGASKAAIEQHYDVGNAFYERFLGPTMAYSAGSWNEPANRDTLDAAQERKLDWHLDAVRADGAARLLEVGCGWGSLARRLVVRRADVSYLGLTLSEVQAGYIRARYPSHIDVQVVPWQEFSPEVRFDGIVSIEALEHFASHTADRAARIAAYREFFAFCARVLRPHGRVSLQANTWLDVEPGREARHLAEFRIVELFPETGLPHVNELVAASDGLFNVLLIEARPHDYVYTHRAWVRRLRENRAEFAAMIGEQNAEKYLRTYTFFLNAFLAGAVSLYRLVLERRGATVG